MNKIYNVHSFIQNRFMRKIMFLCSFWGVFCWSCSTVVENQEFDQTKQTSPEITNNNIADSQQENVLSIEELRLAVKKSREEINLLDQQIDQLLKEM